LVPLPQLDRIAVRISDFGARIVRSLHGAPRAGDALRLERGERAVHVLHFEREALPAEALLRISRRDGLAGIAHHFHRRAAKLQIDEIERAIGGLHLRALALAEAERVLVEGDGTVRMRGEELDMVDALEHG